MDFLTLIQILDSSVRLATPLLLACLAGLFSERAGIFDIGLEGKMLFAAFFSAAVAFTTGSVWLGLLAGIASSMALSGLHGLASITFRGNQLISGVAINFLASGITVLIAQSWFRQGGRTPSLMGGARFEPVTLPFARDDSTGLQYFYTEVISGHSLLAYAAFLCVPLTWWVLYRTRFGLRLRAVGENPGAVDTAGISVVRLRYSALVIAGVLCGLAGTYLASLAAGFVKDMSAGRGYIALAALIFAKWRPWYALGACLLFGLFFAIDNRFQNIQLQVLWIMVLLIGCSVALTFYAVRREKIDVLVLGGLSAVLTAVALAVWFGTASGSDIGLISALWETVKVPSQLIQSLPYLFVVVVLAGFVGKAIPPRAGGQPYVKER